MTTSGPENITDVEVNVNVNPTTNDKENQQQQQHNIGIVNKNLLSQNRDQLQKMGALMDYENDENAENQHRKRYIGSSAAVDSSNSSSSNNNNDESSTAFCTTSSAVFRRRRLTSGGQMAASLLTPHNNTYDNTFAPPAWDGFVRKGTRLKSFLDDALQHVASGYAVTNMGGNKRQRLAEGTNDKDDGGAKDRQIKNLMQPSEEREQAATAMAKDRTAEVILLKQKLEESQAQVASLTASNEALREETQASSLRFEKTIEALKIAAANAASARTDADQAEASSESLSTQLEALQTVVQETKQASLVLYEEQQEISEQARAAQAKLLQTEADLARSVKETKQLREQARDWEEKTKSLQEEATVLKRQLTDATEETRKLNQVIEERNQLEAARKERSKQIEQELREAQALLVDATSAAADTETMEVLKDSILELQSVNKKLHEQLHEQQEVAREEKKRLQESLLEAEREAQTLRIEASLNSDQNAGQDVDDSENGNNSNTAVSPDAALDTSFTISRPASMGSPTDSDSVPHVSTCSICFKAAFGMMKKCQCGGNDCNLRAHVTCANRKNPGPSVSHPGTPGAKLPVILCAGPLANLQKKDYS